MSGKRDDSVLLLSHYEPPRSRARLYAVIIAALVVLAIAWVAVEYMGDRLTIHEIYETGGWTGRMLVVNATANDNMRIDRILYGDNTVPLDVDIPEGSILLAVDLTSIRDKPLAARIDIRGGEAGEGTIVRVPPPIPQGTGVIPVYTPNSVELMLYFNIRETARVYAAQARPGVNLADGRLDVAIVAPPGMRVGGVASGIEGLEGDIRVDKYQSNVSLDALSGYDVVIWDGIAPSRILLEKLPGSSIVVIPRLPSWTASLAGGEDNATVVLEEDLLAESRFYGTKCIVASPGGGKTTDELSRMGFNLKRIAPQLAASAQCTGDVYLAYGERPTVYMYEDTVVSHLDVVELARPLLLLAVSSGDVYYTEPVGPGWGFRSLPGGPGQYVTMAGGVVDVSVVRGDQLIVLASENLMDIAAQEPGSYVVYRIKPVSLVLEPIDTVSLHEPGALASSLQPGGYLIQETGTGMLMMATPYTLTPTVVIDDSGCNIGRGVRVSSETPFYAVQGPLVYGPLKESRLRCQSILVLDGAFGVPPVSGGERVVAASMILAGAPLFFVAIALGLGVAGYMGIRRQGRVNIEAVKLASCEKPYEEVLQEAVRVREGDVMWAVLSVIQSYDGDAAPVEKVLERLDEMYKGLTPRLITEAMSVIMSMVSSGRLVAAVGYLHQVEDMVAVLAPARRGERAMYGLYREAARRIARELDVDLKAEYYPELGLTREYGFDTSFAMPTRPPHVDRGLRERGVMVDYIPLFFITRREDIHGVVNTALDNFSSLLMARSAGAPFEPRGIVFVAPGDLAWRVQVILDKLLSGSDPRVVQAFSNSKTLEDIVANHGGVARFLESRIFVAVPLEMLHIPALALGGLTTPYTVNAFVRKIYRIRRMMRTLAGG